MVGKILLVFVVCSLLFCTGSFSNNKHELYKRLAKKAEKDENKRIESTELKDYNKEKFLMKTERKKIGTAKKAKNVQSKIKVNTKLSRRRNRQESKTRTIKNDHRQSCSGDTPVPSTCMENAAMALIYEKNQVANYLKQAKQLMKHKNLTENKMSKMDAFKETANKMLMAVGGNVSNPICGSNTSDSKKRESQKRALKEHMAMRAKLENCSGTITEACKVPDNMYNETMLEKMKDCNKTIIEYKDFMDTCQTEEMKKSATKQCDCWAEARKKMDALKAKKCQTKDEQLEITKKKNKCVVAFRNCKKMEDESVSLIYTCMEVPMNQSGQALHDEMMNGVKGNLTKAEDVVKQIIAGDLDIERQNSLDTIQ